MAYDLKIYANTVEPPAMNQIYNLLAQPTFANEKIRIMPDVHSGIGCVVGFTSTFTDKIVPNIIGVDIGCGMLTTELGKIDIDFPALDNFIKTRIPSGSAIRKNCCYGADIIKKLRCFPLLRNLPRLYGSMGTLGGGNHFIEIDTDENGNKYLIIHTGSRNLGTQVALIYQKKAITACKTVSASERQELISRLKAENRIADIPNELQLLTQKYAYRSKIPADLCYLDGNDLLNYLNDMRLCQEFAKQNREMIQQEILKFLKIPRASSFETIHNFIDDDNIIRKGAVPAYKGQKLIIPMNMRDGCIIAVGKSNQDWNCSAPHGAGRLISRSDAKKSISLDEYVSTMRGIWTSTANLSTIDEAPQAYKPMDEILSIITPTCEIIRIIKPIYNFKCAE